MPVNNGQRFFDLTAIKECGRDKSGKIMWECLCSCGNKSIVAATELQSGHKKSCGCRRGRVAAARSLTHGQAANPTPTYTSWSSMLTRCTNPKAKTFKAYGGAGITVCERWKIFANFLADMGERPEGTTLDRINNAGNYEPGNCRWADWRTQALNRKRKTECRNGHPFTEENTHIRTDGFRCCRICQAAASRRYRLMEGKR